MPATSLRAGLALAAALAAPTTPVSQHLLGRVVDENGEPVPRAVITLRPLEAPGEEQRTRTSDGSLKPPAERSIWRSQT